ncbi:MAG TPA: Lrp/AsnC family transcriptional regulator [Nitrososphaeraceae archaeon]|jgi:DNA-binding Lrp family transcriptional regulator
MRGNSTQGAESAAGYEISLDDTDFRIISLLVTNHDNKKISEDLRIPLSTIQRRVRNIMLSGIVTSKVEPNFKRLGIKKGLLHVYLSDGDIKSSTSEVAGMDGVLSASVHVGNSDIVSEFVYEDSEQLVDTISNIKHMNGVDRVLWSEEVYSVPVDPENVLTSFKKMWENNNGNTSMSDKNDRNDRNNVRNGNKLRHKIRRSAKRYF